MDLTHVLMFAYKGAEFFLVGNEYSGLQWHDKNIPKPTEEEINAAAIAYDAFLEKERYKELRLAEYPSIQDQLDIIYNEGLDAWKAQIKIIKDKYPPPL